MFNFNSTSTISNFASRRGLYCVWIRASESENAPLVSVWIDPAMGAFEAQMKAGSDLPTLPVPVANHHEHDTNENSSVEKDGPERRRRWRSLEVAAAAALLCALLTPPARSQTGGKITGTVQDQTNAGIPEATVVLTQTATAVRQTTKTDELERTRSRSFPSGSTRFMSNHRGSGPTSAPEWWSTLTAHW